MSRAAMAPWLTPQEILAACRAARGTPAALPMRQLLHDLARERRFRKDVEALRVDQSERLLAAARERDAGVSNSAPAKRTGEP